MINLKINFLFVAPMTFKVEDATLQKTKELIIGTSANLSCSYASQQWTAMPFLRPFTKFFRLDEGGIETEIQDSHEVPPKYENQGNVDKIPYIRSYVIGKRRLFLRRIDESAASTYLCRVKIFGCHLEKKLVLKTSMFYIEPSLLVFVVLIFLILLKNFNFKIYAFREFFDACLIYRLTSFFVYRKISIELWGLFTF